MPKSTSENEMKFIELNLYVCNYCGTLQSLERRLMAHENHLLRQCYSAICNLRMQKFMPVVIDFTSRRFVTIEID